LPIGDQPSVFGGLEIRVSAEAIFAANGTLARVTAARKMTLANLMWDLLMVQDENGNGDAAMIVSPPRPGT
jgi:hypothetical protein